MWFNLHRELSGVCSCHRGGLSGCKDAHRPDVGEDDAEAATKVDSSGEKVALDRGGFEGA